jgi:hypothetical protein
LALFAYTVYADMTVFTYTVYADKTVFAYTVYEDNTVFSYTVFVSKHLIIVHFLIIILFLHLVVW